MNKILCLLISTLLLTSMVPAGFVGINLNNVLSKAATEKKTSEVVKENIKTTEVVKENIETSEVVEENIIMTPVVVRVASTAPELIDPYAKNDVVADEPTRQPEGALLRGGVVSAPATISKDHSVLVVGLINGEIHAYDSNNMRELWSDKTNHKKAILDIQFDGTDVYVAGDGKITRYDSNTGSLVRTYPVSGGNLVYSIAMDADYLYAGAEDGKLYKIRKSDATHVWGGGKVVFPSSSGASWDNVYSVKIMDDHLYVGGGLGYVYEYNKDGDYVSTVYDAYASKIYAMEPNKGKLYIADSTSYENGMVADGDIEIRPGSEKLAAPEPTYVYDLWIDGNNIYSAQANGVVGVWSLSSKAQIATLSTGAVTGTVAVNDKYIFAGDKDGDLTWWNKGNHECVNKKILGFEVTQVNVEYSTKITNEAPVWTGIIPNVNTNEDSPSHIVVNDLTELVSDFEGDTLTFIITSEDSTKVDCEVIGTNKLRITPALNWNGETNCTVRVSDGTNTADKEFNITINPLNDAPVIAELPDKEIMEDSSNNPLFNINTYVTDADGDSLTYSITPSNKKISIRIEENGDVYATAGVENAYGDVDVMVTAIDKNGAYDIETFTITINPLNDAPTTYGLLNKNIPEDSSNYLLFDLDDYFKDVDGDNLTYTILDNYDHSLVTITKNSDNELYATAVPNTCGSTTVTIYASDGKLSTQASFVLTVTNVNDAPVLTTPIPDKTIDEDSTGNVLFDLDNYFSDPDGENLNYGTTSTASNPSINDIIISVVPVSAHNAIATTPLGVKDKEIARHQRVAVPASQIYNGYNTHSASEARTRSYTASNYNTTLVTISINTDGVVTASTATPDATGWTDVTITATDSSGSSASDVFRLTVTPVNDAPVLSQIGNLVGYVNTPFTYDVNATDVDSTGLTYYDNTLLFEINPSTGVISFTPTQEQVGTHEVCVSVSDGTEITQEDFTLTIVDNENPDVTITAPSEGEYFNTSSVTVTYSSTAADVSQYNVRSDSGTWFNNGKNLKYEFTGLSEGSHNLAVQAVDAVGNSAMDDVSVTVDLTNPTVMINYPASNAVLGSGVFSLEWTGSDNMCVDHYTVNGTDVGNTTSYALDLADGNYVYNVVVYDCSGRTASASVSFEVDSSAPSVAIISPSDGEFLSSGNVVVSWDGSGASYYVANGTDVGMNTSEVLDLADGVYSYTVYAFDAAGNNASDSVSFTVDTVAPNVAITSPANNALFADGSVTLEWTGSDTYGISYYTVNGTNVGMNTSYALSLGDGNYTYVVFAFDNAGNNASDSVSFEVDSSAPSVAIISPSDGEFLSSGNVVVSWDGSGASYYVANGTDVGMNTSEVLDLADGVYSYTVYAFDAAGNNASDSVSFTVDTVAPVISNVSVIATNSSATITWNTDELADSRIDYGTTTAYGNSQSDANYTSAHSITVTGLAANTTYYFMLSSTDMAGNTGSYVDVDATNTNFTTNPGDNYMPVAVPKMDSPCFVGGPCDYNGTESYDINGTITAYAWDFGGTGTSNTATGTHVFTNAGNYNVTLTVTDDRNATDNDTITVQVLSNTGIPPVADAGPDQIVAVNSIVTFDGSNSTDNIGIYNYSWAIVGGADIGTGVSPTHNFTNVGLYTIRLTVTDKEGLTDTDDMTVAVYNSSAELPDIAVNNDGFSINPISAGAVNATIKVYNLGNSTTNNFTVRFNHTDTNFSDVTVNGLANAAVKAVSVTYTMPSGNVVFDAIADFNNNITESDETNNKASLTLVDLNAPPIASFTVTPVSSFTRGLRINFNAAASTDSDGTIVNYAWDFGDGGTATGMIATHAYSSAGNFTVTLVVTDDDGATASATRQLSIADTSSGGGGGGSIGSRGTSFNGRGSSESNVTIEQEIVFIDNLVTYEIGDFIVTRDYFYNPNTHRGWYTMNLENIGDKDYTIRLEDANPFNAESSQAPLYTAGDRLGWEFKISPDAIFNVTFNFDSEITPDQVKSIGAPIIEDITPIEEPTPVPVVPSVVPTATPKLEQPRPFTGFLTFLNPEFWGAWTTLLIILAAVILLGVGWVVLKNPNYAITLTGKADSLFDDVDPKPSGSYAEGTLY